jgi:lipid-binding SYLF domain-containing protein
MKKLTINILITFLLSLVLSQSVLAASAEEVDIRVDAAIEIFNERVKEGREFLANAKGVLVFPNIVKAGFFIGGEFGEGALRINNKHVDYYRTTSASFGFQFGAQTKSVIIVFLDDEALRNFTNSSGWEVGVDGSVAIADAGAGGSIDSTNIADPIVAFVFGNKGLMIDVSLAGTKYSKINK